MTHSLPSGDLDMAGGLGGRAFGLLSIIVALRRVARLYGCDAMTRFPLPQHAHSRCCASHRRPSLICDFCRHTPIINHIENARRALLKTPLLNVTFALRLANRHRPLTLPFSPGVCAVVLFLTIASSRGI